MVNRVKPLDAKVSIYVPASKVSKEFEAALVAAFGGFSMTTKYGAWAGADGAVVYEEVCVYEAAFDSDKHWHSNEVMQAEVDRLLDSGEEAVLVEYSQVNIGLISRSTT